MFCIKGYVGTYSLCTTGDIPLHRIENLTHFVLLTQNFITCECTYFVHITLVFSCWAAGIITIVHSC